MAAQRFLVAAEVGDRAENGREQGDDEERDGVDRRQPLGGTALDQVLYPRP